MSFNYSRQAMTPQEKRLQRFLEVLPGALSWCIILGICALSVLQPLAAAVLMVAFLLYWLLRILYMNIFLILSYGLLEVEKDTDWISRINAVDAITGSSPEFCAKDKRKGIKESILSWIHCRQLRALRKSGDLPPASKDIYHLVIYPVIREGYDVVEPGIAAIKAGIYSASSFLLVIALEEAAPEAVKRDMQRIKEKYQEEFLDFLVVEHPSGLPGEARVKGANTTFAAKRAAEYFKKQGIPFENVLVSCFDADTVPSSHYFGCLTYYFMITPDRLRASFQPIPVYHNNIWEAPGFARIIDIGTSFFQLIEATNPNTLVTFSSHSMSFAALVEADYWPVDMISDDSAIFWKTFVHYGGKYRVVPIYATVSMDIATGRSVGRTFSNIYKQKRRWAWGVENLPIVIRAFLSSKAIPLYRKMVYSYKLFDSFVSWSSWSFLLLLGSFLPALFATKEFSSSTVFYTAPRIRGIIYALSFIGILICMVISVMLLPRPKNKYGILNKVFHLFEWLLIPGVIIFLSAVPALDAQTRLMAGKYMEFWVSEKTGKKGGAK